MNTSIKVILYTSKQLSNGEYPVMLRIIKNRKPKYISAGVSCTKDFWDKESGIPNKKHPLFRELKVLIRKKLLEAEKYVLGLENEDKNFSAHEIRGGLKKEQVNNPNLFEYFDNIIKRLQKAGRIKNAEIYKDAKRNLNQYTQHNRIHFSDVDPLFLNQFEEYLKFQGKGGNTIYIYLRTLRALMNKAVNEGYCSEKYYPFKRFSLAKYSKIKTDKRAISKENIMRIKSVKLKGDELTLARNIFLFSYYCRGMNFTDIAFLKWKNIDKGRLSYVRQKTKELFNIELLKPALEILKIYKTEHSISPSDYVFPIFSHSYNTPQSLYNRKVKMLRIINKSLKEVAKKAGIETLLTTYVARHSYATILKQLGTSTTIISQAMGHDSEKTTQIYLDSFENYILDKASRAII